MMKPIPRCLLAIIVALCPCALYGQSVADYFNQGLAYDRAKDWNNAIISYTNALRLDPNLETAVHNRGRAYMETKSYRLAIADLNRAVQLAPSEASAYLDRAHALFRSVEWDPWEDEFEKGYSDVLTTIRLEPNNKYAWYTKAYAEWNDEDDQKAKASLTKLQSLDANFAGAADLLAKVNKSIAANAAAKTSGAIAAEVTKLNAQGKTALDALNYKEAIKLYSQSLAKDPKNSDALFYRGRSYLGEYSNDLAIADYDSYIKIRSDDAAGYTNRGLAKYAKNDYDGAIADQTKAITMSPTWVADAYVRRGQAFRHKKDLITALADFEQALKLKPDSTFALANRAFTYRDNKQFDLAIADATKAISLNPKDSGSYLDRGDIFKDKKDYLSALVDYDQAFKIDLKSTTPINRRIAVFKEQKNLVAAEAEYAKIVAVAPLEGFHSRGHFYWNIGKLDLATADFAECIKQKPDGWAYYWDRGETLRLGKNFAEARADFDQVVKLSPLAPAYVYRGTYFLSAGEIALAEADLKKAAEMKPDDLLSIVGLANLYTAKGDFVTAATQFAAALAKSPNSTGAYLGRAAMFAKQKKTTEAIADLKKALELNADFYEARAELEKLSKPIAKPSAKRPVGRN